MPDAAWREIAHLKGEKQRRTRHADDEIHNVGDKADRGRSLEHLHVNDGRKHQGQGTSAKRPA